MQTFNLVIFRQSRVLVVLSLFPFVLIAAVIKAADSNNILVGLLLFLIYLLTAYYFVVGHMSVTINEGQLHFNWKRKLLFNYKNIDVLNISEIKTIVIDEGQMLRKIITTNKTLRLNTAKVLQKDALRFISYLRPLIKQNGGRNINSGDEWNEKGYIKLAYKAIAVAILLAACLLAYFLT